MSALTWEEIDKCKSARQVYELLKKHGVKGVRYSQCHCPLAVATGWAVRRYCAWTPQSGEVWQYKQIHHLGGAARAFIEEFDNFGRFNDLVEDSANGGDS